MRKTKNLVSSSVLLLILSTMISTVAITPAFAKDLNLPSGANRVDYYNAGGQAEIPLPKPVPPVYPGSATAIRFSFMHVEIPNSNLSFDSLLVWLYLIPTGSTVRSWAPYAVITTSTEDATFSRTFWSGSFIQFDATLYGAPSSYGTDNVIKVDEGVLTIDRHGNDVSVNLNAQQQIKRPIAPPGITYTLPAFSLTLKNYGGSVHETETIDLTGAYLGSSNYTFVIEETGFNANGAITSPGSYLNGASVQNATVSMHGIHTYYPPT